MMRLPSLLLLLGLSLPGRAEEGESRLGTLVRWYLAEPNAARREEILESIRQVSGNDPAQVVESIRSGAHFLWPRVPAFRKGGKAPEYAQWRPRVQPLGEAAGDYAELVLPPDYDRTRAWPLHLDLVPLDLAPSPDAVTVRIDPRRHPQAAVEAQAAEMLVLSILAETMDQVHVDCSRIFLRAQDSRAELAWYIVLQNPDRFAGILGGGSGWKDAEDLLPHGRYFASLAVLRRNGDSKYRKFLEEIAPLRAGHLILPAGTPLEPIAAWFAATSRPPAPSDIQLVCNRPAAMRAYWFRVAPRERSLQGEVLGGQWNLKAMRQPATARARVDASDRNLIHVDTERVTAFWIYVDPSMFDAGEPLRVSINGSVAAAKYIEHNIAYLLEDYAERRDPQLLYCCRLAFTARGP